jgi:hypothetical protein
MEEVERPVFVAEETIRFIVAAVNDVHGNAGQHDARASGHG